MFPSTARRIQLTFETSGSSEHGTLTTDVRSGDMLLRHQAVGCASIASCLVQSSLGGQALQSTTGRNPFPFPSSCVPQGGTSSHEVWYAPGKCRATSSLLAVAPAGLITRASRCPDSESPIPIIQPPFPFAVGRLARPCRKLAVFGEVTINHHMGRKFTAGCVPILIYCNCSAKLCQKSAVHHAVPPETSIRDCEK